MPNYSRSQHRFDARNWRKFAVIGLLTALLSACAASASRPAAISAPADFSSTAPTVEAPAAAEPVAATPTATAAPRIREDAPLRYVVKQGDTLWQIANRYLLDPWQWPEIWTVNDKVRNPHLIYPGDVLKLSMLNGRPQLGLDVERLRPQVRSLPLDQAIPTIPLDAIRDFLRGPRLVTLEQMKSAPYLLAFVDAHLIGGEGHLIYVKNLPNEAIPGWALARTGQAYRDPDDGRILGYEATPIGTAEITEFGQPATARLTQTYREARVGDRLLPLEADAFQTDFFPHAPDRRINGRIIAAFDGLSQIGQFQIVAINRGSQHGLEPGHVLQILQGGARVADPYASGKVQLPDQPAGQMLVFKTTARLSYALVMSVTRPVHRLDKVETPRPLR